MEERKKEIHIILEKYKKAVFVILIIGAANLLLSLFVPGFIKIGIIVFPILCVILLIMYAKLRKFGKDKK